MNISRFRGSLAAKGAIIDWAKGPLIYTRCKISANPYTAEPGVKGILSLESLVLPEGTSMENLPPHKKEALNKGSATTFALWYVEY